MADASSTSKNTLRRYDLQTDILLAIMLSVVMIGVFLLLNIFGMQEV